MLGISLFHIVFLAAFLHFRFFAFEGFGVWVCNPCQGVNGLLSWVFGCIRCPKYLGS